MLGEQDKCWNKYEKKIERKFAEVFMALEIEKKCSKSEILELYINTSFFWVYTTR